MSCCAAEQLSLDCGSPLPPDEMARCLACSIASVMHERQPQDCVPAFGELIPPLLSEKAASLRRYLEAKWVENESVEILLHASHTPEARGLLALNTSHVQVTNRYIDRVNYELPAGRTPLQRISVPEPKGDFEEHGLIHEVESAIRAVLVKDPLYDSEGNELPLEGAVRELLSSAKRFAICILPPQYTSKDVLLELRRRFSRIIFIVEAGDKSEHMTNCFAAGARQLNPLLKPAKLNEFAVLRRDLDATFDQYNILNSGAHV